MSVLVNLEARITISIPQDFRQPHAQHVGTVFIIGSQKPGNGIFPPTLGHALQRLLIVSACTQQVHDHVLPVPHLFTPPLLHSLHQHGPLAAHGIRIRQLGIEGFGTIFPCHFGIQGSPGFRSSALFQPIQSAAVKHLNILPPFVSQLRGIHIRLFLRRFHIRQVKSGGSLALRHGRGREVQRHVRSGGPVKRKIVVHGEKCL